MTRVGQMYADKIRADPLNPFHPCFNSFLKYISFSHLLLSPVFPVEATVLDGFGKVIRE